MMDCVITPTVVALTTRSDFIAGNVAFGDRLAVWICQLCASNVHVSDLWVCRLHHATFDRLLLGYIRAT